MLGQDLVAHFSTRHEVVPLDRNQADITDASLLSRAISRAEPDVIVHAAAFTAVDDCERQPELAFRVNAEGTGNLAQICRQSDIPMLYLSTDYVFDGEKASPYVETDSPAPLNVYGKSKLKGERYVADLVESFWIVRTSWLFGPLGRNFVRSILQQARRGEPLRVVSDQVGAPTYTADLAEKLEEILEKGSSGIYHVTNQGYCSWFEFAKEILQQSGLNQVAVSAIPTSASGRAASRPRNSRLAPARLESEGFDLLPPWRDALRRYLARAEEPNTETGRGTAEWQA